MDPVILSKSLTTASANCIAQSQSIAAAGTVTLNGGSVVAGVWTLDTQRRVAIVSAGNDSTITATWSGHSEGGQSISETLTLTNAGTATSAFDYLNGGSITLSGSTASTITIGTNGTGSTAWKNPNIHIAPFNLAIENAVTGSVTYNLEFTIDDYFTPPPRGVAPTAPRVRQTVVNGATTDTSYDFNSPVRGWRETVTAGTGTVTAEAIQSGIVNY